MARIAFVAVTDDDYELTVFSGDTCKELAQWLGVSNANHIASALCRSKTGTVKMRGKPYRYMRLNPNTGKIYVGKLPAAIREQLQADGAHSQRGRKPRPVAAVKGEDIFVYPSVPKACEALYVCSVSIYQAIRNNTKCAGYYWHYI